MKLKKGTKYMEYTGDIYEVSTVTRDPNNFFNRTVHLRGKLELSFSLRDFDGYKVLKEDMTCYGKEYKEGDLVKRFVLIK